MSGTKSLGRAEGMRYLREGDASLEPKVEYSPSTAKASTLSRKESGRGSVRRPALTKAALLRQEAGDKKVEEQDKQRNKNNYGLKNNFDFLRSRTPKDSRLTRSKSMCGTESYRNDRCRSNTVTPQMPRRQSPSVGRAATSPYSWQPSTQSNERAFQPLVKPSAYWPLSSSTRAEPDGIEHEKEDDLGGQ